MTSAGTAHGAGLARWGRAVAGHARGVVLLWLGLTAAAFAVALGAVGTPSIFDRLETGEILVDGENRTGRELLADAGGSGFSTYTLLVDGVDVGSPEVARAATAAAGRLLEVDTVVSAANPFVVDGGLEGPRARSLLSGGSVAGGGFATVVGFDPSNTAEQEAAATARVDEVFDRLVADTGAAGSERGGVRRLVDRIVEQVKVDGQRGEGIALPVSFAVMVVVFGGFLAAGFPVLGAVASIAGSLVSLLGFSYLLEVDATAVNVVTVLGLGLCIDYGLLVVSRFREELRSALNGRAAATATAEEVTGATGRTLDRAGRTVVFSALVVAISLAGLLFLEIELIRAVALAGVSVVLLALAVALTLIPALCTLGARRLLRRGTEVAGDEGVFSRLAEAVHRAPWVVIGVVSAALVTLALPLGGLSLTSSGAELLPTGTPERVFFQTLRADYPTLAGPQVQVVTTAPAAQVQAWAADASDRPGVQDVEPVRTLDDGVVTVGFQTGDSGSGEASRALTASLRTDRPPFEASVVGQASGIADFETAVADRAPWSVAAVVTATLALLFLMTGSVVIPVKALVMNLLSLGASLGVAVWVFQEGHLEGALDFSSTGALEVIVPVLVVAFGFGLSMDYEVFLLSRIVELHESGRSTREAVVLGLQRSGRIITSAALLMVIVFSGFAAGELLVMKQMGVALVLAIAVDATLVRMLLVPATMAVLGRANWWAPTPLRRLHARYGVTE